MRKKTIALVLAMVMLLTLALSGCGGDTTSSTASGTGGTSSTTDGSTASTDDGGETSTTGTAAEGITTAVNTPRSETLIVECQSSTDTPGQFNTYMTGTATGFGIHQLMSGCRYGHPQ